jgi:hypothetical protein
MNLSLQLTFPYFTLLDRMILIGLDNHKVPRQARDNNVSCLWKSKVMKLKMRENGS